MQRYLRHSNALRVLAVMLALCVVMASTWATKAYAADDAQTGSITLSLSTGANSSSGPLVGGEIALYRVASVEQDNADKRFDITGGQFATSNIVSTVPNMDTELLEANNKSLSIALEALIAKDDIKPIETAAVTSGKATFASIPEGLYLLVQPVASEGNRLINSFILSIPDEEGNLDVVCQPKSGIYEGGDSDNEGSGNASEGGGETPPPEGSGGAGSPSTSATNTSSTKTSSSPTITQRIPQTGDLRPEVAPVLAMGIAAMATGLFLSRRHRGDA